MNTMTPRELTRDEISILLRDVSEDGKYEPPGLFYHQNGNSVTGIDNSTGEAWTEDFPTLEGCLEWLTNKTVRHVHCYECAYVAETNGKYYCNFGDSDHYGKPVTSATGCKYGEEN